MIINSDTHLVNEEALNHAVRAATTHDRRIDADIAQRIITAYLAFLSKQEPTRVFTFPEGVARPAEEPESKG